MADSGLPARFRDDTDTVSSILAYPYSPCYFALTMNAIDLPSLWFGLVTPLGRLLLAMCVGLLVANVVEALHWTRPLARLTAPLVRLARLGTVAGASFSMAFFSPAASNALLAESHARGDMSRRELVLANLFNSLPAYMVHLPTMLFLIWPVLGPLALVYTGLTLVAAMLRTLLTAGLGRCLLPPPPEASASSFPQAETPVSFRKAFHTALLRFRRRIPKLFLFTIPIYTLMFLMQRHGVFQALQDWLGLHLPWMSSLKPEALGIVLLSLAAEIGASLSAAGSALDMGGLSETEVVLALLVGNILSTPMRTIRHQFPAYAGYYSPALALQLILVNQSLRAMSMIGVTFLYWYWTHS